MVKFLVDATYEAMFRLAVEAKNTTQAKKIVQSLSASEIIEEIGYDFGTLLSVENVVPAIQIKNSWIQTNCKCGNAIPESELIAGFKNCEFCEMKKGRA